MKRYNKHALQVSYSDICEKLLGASCIERFSDLVENQEKVKQRVLAYRISEGNQICIARPHILYKLYLPYTI